MWAGIEFKAHGGGDCMRHFVSHAGRALASHYAHSLDKAILDTPEGVTQGRKNKIDMVRYPTDSTERRADSR